MNKRILFLCSGRRVSLVERFKKEGCVIICTDMDPYAPTRSVCDAFEFSPSFKDKQRFITDINEMCVKHNVDAIIPLYDEAIDICCDADLKAKWFGPDRQTNNLLFSKRESIAFFNSLRLLAPAEVVEYTGKKLVGRDLTGCGSRGLHFINSLEEFNASKVLYPNSIYTQFVGGKEYTIDCYKNSSGHIIGIIPRERIKVRSGEVLVSKTVRHAVIAEQAELIMKNLNLLGPCTLQCIEDENGDIWWIEGNPRFGGGAILSLEASLGKNYVGYVIDDIVGKLNDYYLDCCDDSFDWDENVVMTRADREFFSHV